MMALLNNRLAVLIAAFVVFVYGAYSFLHLPIDAFPDISPTQAKIIIKAPGMTPEEIEQRVVRVLEIELMGLEGQTMLKSTAKYAIADITIDFLDKTDIYKARAQINERLLAEIDELPDGVTATLAPITTPLSEAYMFTVEGNITQKEKRAILDFTIRPALRTIKGVADLNALGGEAKTAVVVPDLMAMGAMGITLDDLKLAIEENLKNDGAGRVVIGDESHPVRVQSGIKNADDIAKITLPTPRGVTTIGAFCQVRDEALTRLGFVTKDGVAEATEGIVLTLRNANTSEVIAEVKKRLASLVLPQGVTINPFYDRSELTKKAVDTVSAALFEAVVLIVLLLLLFLGDLRAAVVVATILPLAMAMTFVLMRYFDLSANLMSLGGLAVAVGMLVDSAIVIVENSYAKLGENRTSKLDAIREAMQEVGGAVFSGILIIAIVFVPLLTLDGLEGKLFTPVAVTIIFALVSSLVLSLSVIPVLSSLLLKLQEHKETALNRFFKNIYTPALIFTLTHTKLVFALAGVFMVASFSLFWLVGKTFMPTLDEGDIVLLVEPMPSISLEASRALDLAIQKELLAKVPEIKTIVARTGTDELGLDPMTLNQTDTFLILKPKDEWRVASKDELHEKIKKVLEPFSGVAFGFTQPIDMRISEMLTGTRGDLAVKIFGDDIGVLNELSEQVGSVLERVDGADEVTVTLNDGIGYLTIEPKRLELAKVNLSNAELQHYLKTALDGVIVTTMPVNNTILPVMIRLDESISKDVNRFSALEIPLSNGSTVPLSSIATIKQTEGPVQVIRENSQRVSIVRSNVKDRDLVGFVEDARSKIGSSVKLPAGYKIVYGGEFENQQRVSERLFVVIPVSIGAIFLILFFTFGSIKQTALILLNIPFAITGGIIALYISGEYLSVPASVGFIALFGIAVLNGIVMVSYFNLMLKNGSSVDDAVRLGAAKRLRPVLMTAFIAAFGLIPLLFASGVGSEIQRPLAIVVLGGLVTSTILTLLLLPPAYRAISK